MNQKNKPSAASQVKELREKTGASVMECRNALLESEGEIGKAVEYLKKRGNEKAIKKAQRATSEGVVASYIHSNRKIGAIVELFCETDFVARNAEFQDLAHDIAMHIAAMAPKYLSFERIPQKDREEYEQAVRQEIASLKKSADVVEKIVEGKVKKHFEEISLLDQSFVKNPDITVDGLIKEKISKVGENIQIGDFARYEI